MTNGKGFSLSNGAFVGFRVSMQFHGFYESLEEGSPEEKKTAQNSSKGTEKRGFSSAHEKRN
jgi:hypothetical protein